MTAVAPAVSFNNLLTAANDRGNWLAGFHNQASEKKPVANANWGTKHTCQGCGAKYYDMNRSPVVCPKCNAAFNPEALLRSRRSRPANQAKVAEHYSEYAAGK